MGEQNNGGGNYTTKINNNIHSLSGWYMPQIQIHLMSMVLKMDFFTLNIAYFTKEFANQKPFSRTSCSN